MGGKRTHITGKEGGEKKTDDARGGFAGVPPSYESPRKSDSSVMAAAFGLIKDAVVSIGPKTKIISWNTAAERIFGYSSDEAMRMSVRALVPFGPLHESLSVMEEGAVTNLDVSLFNAGLRKDGSSFPAEVSATTWNDQEGNLCMTFLIKDISNAVQVQQALEVRETQFRRLFDLSPDTIVHMTLEGEIVDCNSITESTTGKPRDVLVGRNFSEFGIISYKDKLRLKALFDGLDEAKRAGPIEMELTREDGTTLWLEVSASITNSVRFGQLVQVVGRDITREKRLQIQLSTDEHLLQKVMGKIKDLVVVLDLATMHPTYVSPAIVDISGITPEEACAQDMLDYLTPGSVENIRDIITKELIDDANKDPNRSIIIEIEPVTKTGNVSWAETTSSFLRDANGLPVALVVVARDITRRKRAEEALRKSEAQFRELANSLPQIVFEATREGKIMFMNRHGIKTAGYAHEELDDISLFDLVDETGRARLVEAMQSPDIPLAQGEVLTARRKDGKTFPIIFHFTPLRESDEVVGIRGIAIDITDRLMLEEEQRLHAKMDAISLLASRLAHDYNNIVTAILGNITLAAETDDLQESRACLKAAENASNVLTGLNNQLLSFSKGGKSLKKLMDISVLVRETTSFGLSGTSVSFEHDFGDNPLSAEVDPTQIAELVNNLTVNAIQAMPDGGALFVSGEKIMRAGKPFLKFSFMDNGKGIEEDVLPRIFDPYFTTKPSGNGLGLAASLSIVKKHGGSISAESAPGKGTTITFLLPASEKMPEQKKTVSEKTISGRGKILVLDDETQLLNVMKRMLGRMGYDVLVAEEGESAVALFREAYESGNPFSVAILDVTNKKGKGGLWTNERLREIDSNVRIILTSGYAEGGLSRASELGVSGILEKPFTVQTLSTIVSRTVLGECQVEGAMD